ncbi:MAG: hypothetical protein MRECE_37c004 [Mycoplasmataceae bacterium CE_OT135]|nr:MAG: hypothetical protein MRECE_37c004 [Mycoplasmataceae bacterium CE_OT135]
MKTGRCLVNHFLNFLQSELTMLVEAGVFWR